MPIPQAGGQPMTRMPRNASSCISALRAHRGKRTNSVGSCASIRGRCRMRLTGSISALKSCKRLGASVSPCQTTTSVPAMDDGSWELAISCLLRLFFPIEATPPRRRKYAIPFRRFLSRLRHPQYLYLNRLLCRYHSRVRVVAGNGHSRRCVHEAKTGFPKGTPSVYLSVPPPRITNYLGGCGCSIYLFTDENIGNRNKLR